MKFHREGTVSILLATIVSLAVVVTAYYFFERGHLVQPMALILAAFLMLTILQFFRNPPRRKVVSEGAVIAPADGKVVVIEETTDSEYFNDKVIQVSIFMSPTNVHINWYPVDGEVVYSKYHAGKYLVAWNPKSSTENERHSVVIRTEKYGDILVKQIAGALARRIVNYAQVGDKVSQGQELGFIKFGSRVDVLLPLSSKVELELEQKSFGAQTILAELAQQVNHS